MSCESRQTDPPERRPDIVALVMAAGVSRRFGSDKRRARLDDGQTLLETTLATVAQVYSRCRLITRQDDDIEWALHASSGQGELQRWVAAQAGNGLGGSLGDAFRHLIAQDDPAIAAAVVLADMPWLSATTCAQLNCHAHSEHIVIPSHQGKRGHPVLFGRRFWPALAELQGGDGARSVVQSNPQAVKIIDVDDLGIWRDVDTPQDLQEPM
ncbi:nucleotidyltransferase family protein [Salinicola halimionae]|uniref:nucleotidyltransferase family protein n=1 Tax=Salinicola halimionae TaxID=1949081 RepID=UPI000DA261D5|nr:nucleotidyltransferase family protein [Salinicola halimionae]